jgi:hypothetical protein
VWLSSAGWAWQIIVLDSRIDTLAASEQLRFLRVRLDRVGSTVDLGSGIPDPDVFQPTLHGAALPDKMRAREIPAVATYVTLATNAVKSQNFPRPTTLVSP